MLSSKKIQTFLGLAVSGGLILWMLFEIDWSAVGDEVRAMRLVFLVPCFLVLVAHFYARSLRWKYLLPETSEIVKLREYFNAIMVGNFATYIFPLRLGEVIRPYLFSSRSPYKFSTAFVSVVIERFFDLAMVLIAFGVVGLLVPDMPAWVYQGATALSVLALLLLAFMIFSALLPKFVQKIVTFFLRPLPEKFRVLIQKFIDDLLEGAAILARGGSLVKVITLSALVWILTFVFYYLFLLVFNIPGDWILAVTVTVIIALAVAAPSAPGFIGVYQVACIAAFSLFGQDKEVATAYALISHVLQYVIFVGYGAVVLSQYNLSLSSLKTRPPSAIN